MKKIKDLTLLSDILPTGYHRQLMQAILHDKIQIAKAVNVTLISLEEASGRYKDFDLGAAKKFVIDPHRMVAAA